MTSIVGNVAYGSNSAADRRPGFGLIVEAVRTPSEVPESREFKVHPRDEQSIGNDLIEKAESGVARRRFIDVGGEGYL